MTRAKIKMDYAPWHQTTGRSAPIYRLNGENRHLMGSLMPEDNQKPKFAQLYIFDTENETRNRLSAMRKSGTETDQEDDNDPSIDKEIVCDIKKILEKNNIFVKWFRCSGEILNKYKAADIKLRLVSRRTRDGRVHNLPQASEVAALIVGDVENLENRRDIIIQRKDKSLIRINELHVGYLPLQYPLMFLYGEDGFRDDVLHCETDRSKEKNSKTVTMKEYFSYRLMERATESPRILFGRRLLQQFIVDAYTMVESYRLTFLKHHQQDLRCDSYSALDDALNRGDDNSANTGKRIILPSTFVGGARYMIQNYHDAMTICRWVGYPNLFITFTCNPKWPEIERYVSDRGLYATDRPDIVARVFHAKLDNMMRDIRHDKLFGETSAVIYTIEFQKRGLPHAHILLFLKGYSEHVSADVVDSIISAEIPNESDDEEYYDCVKEYMMHGPCGEYDKKSPCMFGDKCTKHFPKKFVNRTTVDNDGFVMYKRRDEGRKVVKNGIELDNRSVVPHNPVLLKKYNAHINVEWCNRSRSIKYLFKYVHKGNDRTTAVFYKSHEQPEGEKVIDEIKQYLDCRYISASEAAWRLFGYEIHFREPNIVRLGFHLPDEQSIVYKESSSVTEVVTKMSSKETMFTAWLLANTKYQEARNLTYAEMPQKFVWDNETREWRPRKRAFAFGRLSYIFPGSGELYYFRILLNVVRGCTSYEDVRFYNNKLYSSYKEACYARGLLDDDKEYIDAIKEASVWASDQMLRSLFVNMLIHNVLSSPQTVWEECKDEMSVDILSKYRKEMNCQELTLTDDEIHNKCLQYIEDMMKREGRSLKDVNNMPYPTDSLEFPRNSLIAAELSYDKNALRREHEQLVAMLNDEQSNAYNSIVRSLDKAEGQVYFLYGYGGTGKTFVWKTLSAAVRSIGHIVLNVASSGIASLLLPGGRTSHSKFSIPITLHEASTCNITLQSDLAKLIVKTKLIIWDEAPMMHRNCFEALDRTVRDIMKSHQPEVAHMPFGGKVIVFGGDFRQILPVIPKGRREDIVGATINSSPIWRDCKVLRLTKNMRLQNSVDGNASRMLRDFSEWLSCIGDGTLGADNDGEADIEIPEEFLITHSDNHIESIVQATYPSFHEHIGDISFLEGRAILAPTLEDVDRINEYMVSMHNTDEKIYLSSDSIAQSDRGVSMFEQMHSVEFLNTIKCSGLPNHELKLKIGVPIMLLRNMDATNGLCNGTRLVITQLGNHVIEAKVLGGNNSGDHVLIPRIPITPSDTKLPFAFQRRQFPIMISYAMTINKSQGQSLRNVGVFLRKPVFTHGQLYVALSRVTNREGLKLLLCDEKGNLTNKTTNVVYKEVFQNL